MSSDFSEAPRTPVVSVSIVSHAQGQLVERLLTDLAERCATPLEVLLTMNVDEPNGAITARGRLPQIRIHNDEPRGFGANHNAAFARASGEFFCVMNPDVRVEDDPFPALIAAIEDTGAAVAGPRIVAPDGALEDSGRVFPTVGLLLQKLWRRGLRHERGEPDYRIGDDLVFPDWIGGMCMLFRSSGYAAVGGFDERYFLYYEDVDLCWRLRRTGATVVLQPAATVVHTAQRSSWRRLRYLRWHLSSMVRFLRTQARA